MIKSTIRGTAGTIALFAFAAVRSPAQGQATAQDTTHTSSTSATPPQNVWLSLGFGAGLQDPDASNASLNYSRGRFLTTLRVADIAHCVVCGDGVLNLGRSINEVAFLAGERSSGQRLFATGALGLSLAQFCRTSSACGQPGASDPRRASIAYEFGAHAAVSFAGLGLLAFGNLGPGKVDYTALGVSLQLGWLGR